MTDTSAVARRDLLLPLLVSVGALAAVVVVAAGLGYNPFDSATWARWDSGLYEDIARDGYDLFPCEEEPSKWCGDAAWFPGYPWLVGALHQLGLPLRGTAVLISWLFAAGTIIFSGRRSLNDARSRCCSGLFYAAFAPGQIYYYAVFPLSLLTFSTVACLWLLYRECFLAAGIAGAVAALAYPVGVLLAPISAVWLIAQRGAPLGERLRRVALACGPILAGIWILMIVQRIDAGHWDAFFLIQENYEELHGSQNPFVGTWDIVRGGAENLSGGISVVIALQTAFVTVVLGLLFVFAFRRRRSLDRVDVLLLLWAVVTWAALFQAFSVQRGQAALLPLAVLVARLPSRIAWLLAVAAAAIAVWMETYFLSGTLI